MKYVTIGTAGHVDHGKTCLIRALTGVDTDRLAEEKRRGITIESGYTKLDLPSGRRAGIVDVPGHERFIRNMLCGAWGVDAALLVVSAEEGVKPQTVEHLDILSFLGVKGGITVMTKCDLADTAQQRCVEDQICRLTRGTFLEQAPILRVSSKTGEGLERLKNAIDTLCEALPEPTAKRWEAEEYRLALDRVFTLPGQGIIGTGTLADGPLAVGSRCVQYPRGKKVRIRGIQVYGEMVPMAYPGQRTAVQIAGAEGKEIHRGDVLAPMGVLEPVKFVDVKVTLAAHGVHPLKNGSRIHIYHGPRELLGKIVLIGTEALDGGQMGYAQLCLQEPEAFQRGDRLVLRQDSLVETAGGAYVLDPAPKKHRRARTGLWESFQVKENGTAKERLELALMENTGRFLPVKVLGRRYLDGAWELSKARRLLEQENKTVRLGEKILIHRSEFELYRKRTKALLDEYMQSYPLEQGMPGSQLLSVLSGGNPHVPGKELLQAMEREKLLKVKGPRVHPAHLKNSGKPKEYRQIEEEFRRMGLAPLAVSVYQERLDSKEKKSAFYALVREGQLIFLNDGCCIHRTSVECAKKQFAALAAQMDTVSLPAFKEALGCSRKIAIAILEYFDKIKYTRKQEAGRVLF